MQNRRSPSEKAKAPRRGLVTSERTEGLGTWLFSLVRDEDRGDDLVFEIPDEFDPPPA
jgi:hypothetical protein